VSFLLPGSDVRLPRLGYGCAGLMGRRSQAESERLLHTAVDLGITHLDVARSYGYGAAERAVGRVLAARPGEVTIATKLGIVPPPHATALRAAKVVARHAARRSARVRAALRAPADRMVTGGRFSTEDARTSLAQSLRALRVDAVDLLLLHDCEPTDLHDDLLAYLHSRVDAGDIRAFGIATHRGAAIDIVRSQPEWAPVVQVPDSVLHELPTGLGPAVITHSAIAAAHDRLLAVADANPLSAALGGDLRQPGTLARLLVAAALRRNPEGTVLVFSGDADHIQSNARLLIDAPPAHQLDALGALAAAVDRPAPRTGAAGGSR
jgi:diketogulonate reductase-like aldo/keto reductase